MAGGGSTNKGRASGEQVIAAAFQARGLPMVPWATFRREGAAGWAVVRAYPFISVYGTPAAVEFVVTQGREPQFTVEVKHQNVSGSVDEKLPYVLLNALYQWPTPAGVLVLSGDHWAGTRGKAAVHAMQQLSGRLMVPGRSFEILDMTGGLNWIARTF